MNQPNKAKLLYLLRLLQEETDEKHPMPTVKIMEELSKLGIQAQRKTIYTDMETLREFGCHIVSTKGKNGGWYLARREFTMPEVRLLMDAVRSAGFITPKKTLELVDKLSTLTSRPQAKNIQKQVHVEHQLKCTNEEIYETIELLHKAIQRGRQVSFLYRRRKLDENQKPFVEEKPFTVSPYAMLWENDHYYLVCNYVKYDNLMHLRIDRICHMQVTDTRARNFAEVSSYKTSFDVADYAQKLFHMFSGDTQTVELHCSNSMLEEILDRFGMEIPLRIVDDAHFSAKIQGAVSQGLVSWLMQYGSDIKIISPENLKNMYREKLDAMQKNYK